MTEQWLWGDGQDLLWGDGEVMGDGSSLLSTGTTWNPADKGEHVTLSNGDLTATGETDGAGTTYSWARGTTSKASGKWYFEVTVDATSGAGSFGAIGIANAASNVSDYLGKSANEALYWDFGEVWVSNAATATLEAYVTGDVVACAIDLDAGRGWVSRNGVFASGNPAAGTGSHFTFTPGTEMYPGFTISDETPAFQITANFGATAFGAEPPSGFTGWDLTPTVVAATAASTSGAGRLPRKRSDYESQVRAKWDEIEAIERRIEAKEQAERERVRKVEETKRQLAELEEKKRQTKTIAERRRKLQARIEGYEAQVAAIRAEMIALIDEIERVRVAAELQQTIADRRRRMMLALLTAA